MPEISGSFETEGEDQHFDEVASPALPAASKDSKCRAVIAMNVATLSNTGLAVAFKYISADGFSAVDYNLCRNVTGIIISIIWARCLGINPLKRFPFK